MKRFKIFTASVMNDVDEVVNKWLEENPDVDIIDFRYERLGEPLKAKSDHILILYEKHGELVEMECYYDAFANVTQYRCPKCGYQKISDGLVTLHDLTCPSCKKGADI